MPDQEFKELPAAYTPPMLRVSATYSATDGSCPEHIEVEINYPADHGPHFDTDARTIVAALASVPAGRWRPAQFTTPTSAAVSAENQVIS